MANYAYLCPNCQKVYYSKWGTWKCPVCGKTLYQSKSKEEDFKLLSFDKQEKEFLSMYAPGTSEYNKIEETLLKMRTPEAIELAKEAQDKELARLEAEREAMQKLKELRKAVIVTTADLHVPYEIIGPVYYQLNNAGGGSSFDKLCKHYSDELQDWELNGQGSKDAGSKLETLGAVVNLLSIISGGPQDRDLLGVAHSSFDKAFFIATQELKTRALLLGADAIVGMRQDIDLDTNGFQHFYLQMYGTAVKIKQTV